MVEDFKSGRSSESTVTAFEQKNYYERLGVPRTASQSDIKDAYLKLINVHHPDKNQGNHSAGKITQLLNEAYDVLKKPDARGAYDKKIGGGASPSTNQSRPERPTPPGDPNHAFWEELRRNQQRSSHGSGDQGGAQQKYQQSHEEWHAARKAKEAQEEKERQEKIEAFEKHIETWCSSVLHVDIDVERGDRLNELFIKTILTALYDGSLTLRNIGYGAHFRPPHAVDIFSNVTIRKSPIGVVAFGTDRNGRRAVYIPHHASIDEVVRQLKQIISPTLKGEYGLMQRAESVMEKWEFIKKTLHHSIQTSPSYDIEQSLDVIDVLYEYVVANKEKIQAAPADPFQRKVIGFYSHRQEDTVGSVFIEIGSATMKDRVKLRNFLDTNLPL